jgi:hypothetical protein
VIPNFFVPRQFSLSNGESFRYISGMFGISVS